MVYIFAAKEHINTKVINKRLPRIKLCYVIWIKVYEISIKPGEEGKWKKWVKKIKTQCNRQ